MPNIINKDYLDKIRNKSHDLEYAYGPLNKSDETRLFEKIIDMVILDRYQQSQRRYRNVDYNNEREINFSIKNNQLYINFRNKEVQEVNITELLKKVNLSQIALSETNLRNYEDLYENNSKNNKEVLSKEDFHERILKADLTQQEYLPKLSHAEMLAIYSYSSKNYKDMNGLLRGILIPSDPAKTLVDIAIASQGLNKVPDIELPIVTRYQDEYGLENMKTMTAKGEVQNVTGFTSAAYTPQSRFGRVQIIYENVKGKSISALSQVPYETEYLIPPNTLIKYTGYKFENGCNIFIAEGANILLDQVYSKKSGIAARIEIEEKINDLSKIFKDSGLVSDKELNNFKVNVAQIAYKHGLINNNILNKYIEPSELSSETDQAQIFRKLLMKDKLILAAKKVIDKLGLKSLSSGLENKISLEGKKTIKMEEKRNMVFNEARNIGGHLTNIQLSAKSKRLFSSTKNVSKSNYRI